jgi:hypothetical protein
MTWEKVRDEPPQKSWNMRVSPWSPKIVTCNAIYRVRGNILDCDMSCDLSIVQIFKKWKSWNRG